MGFQRQLRKGVWSERYVKQCWGCKQYVWKRAVENQCKLRCNKTQMESNWTYSHVLEDLQCDIVKLISNTSGCESQWSVWSSL